MSREIKFRVWDKTEKRMIDVFGIELDSNRVTFDGTDYYLIGKEVELMQYTGLKDKNGKEIYEGDIVDHAPHMDRKEFGLTYCEVVKWDESRAMWQGLGRDEGFSFNSDLLVIGNIYENSELLSSGSK